jgi:hypothetical protein
MKKRRKGDYSTQKFIEKSGEWKSDGDAMYVWEKYLEELLYGKRADTNTMGDEKGMSNNVRTEEEECDTFGLLDLEIALSKMPRGTAD